MLQRRALFVFMVVAAGAGTATAAVFRRPALRLHRNAKPAADGLELLLLRGGGQKAKDLEEPPNLPAVSKSDSGGVPLAVTVFVAGALWIGLATMYYSKCEVWPLAQAGGLSVGVRALLFDL